MDKKRRMKSLNLKVEHLRLEIEDREESIRNFERDFLEEISKIEIEEINGVQQQPVIPQVNLIDQSVPDEEEVPPGDFVDRPEDIKKVWKSIAALTHPDKTGNDPEKTELYKRASEAMNKGSFDEIFRIAVQLGIDLPDMGDNGVEILQSISSDLEKKLKDTETSVLWMWGTTSPEKRQGIIDIYLRSRGKKRKPPVQSGGIT